MEQKLFPLIQFCKMYAISREALYKEAEAKRIQLIKRGRRFYVSNTEARKWARDLPRIPENMKRTNTHKKSLFLRFLSTVFFIKPK